MNKKKKQTIAAIAATALLVSGTYAWQAFDQIVRNESAGFDADQGARLHNDFDGSNADVYVENYASDSGATVFTRVRLYEYMELGTGAGNLKDSDGAALDYDAKVAAGITVLRGDLMENSKPDINDESTWDVYLHEGNSRGEEDIHTYLNINYGDVDNSNNGAKVYMPTFNKNFDDNTADIKGSLNNSSDRTDGDRVATDAYDSYVEYTLGESMTGTAVYSKDALIAQNTSAGTIDGNTFLVEDEEHTAKSTLEGYVITMSDWLALEGLAQIGDFWVIDTDGWAYWANGIAPQTATSLLVDSITKVRQPDESYHYALHVEAQSATSDGWIDGVAAMNKGDIDENALSLMEMCWDTDAAIYTIDSIAMTSKPTGVELAPGGELQLSATVTTSEEPDKAKMINWTVEEQVEVVSEVATMSTGLSSAQLNATIKDGLFKPVAGMGNKYYRLIATAKYDASKSDEVVVYVYEPTKVALEVTAPTGTLNEDGIIELQQYRTLQFQASVAGVTDQKVSWSISDQSTVVSGTTISTSGALKIDGEEAIDNIIEVVATSTYDEDIIGTLKVKVLESQYDPTTAKITVTRTSSTMNKGATQTLTAVVSDSINGSAIDQDVTWSVSSATGVSINASTGVLTVEATAVTGTTVTIAATSKTYDNAAGTASLAGTTTVTIGTSIPGYTTDAQVIALVGGTTTVTVNGVEFYVLESGTFSSKTAVKLLAVSSVGSSLFNSSTNDGNAYSTSLIRTYVLDWYNNTFLPGGNIAHANVVTTGTTTRSTGDPAITTSDYAFLLSSTEASALSDTIRTTGSSYWLRTPDSDVSNYACLVTSSGKVYYNYMANSHAVRPALWIYL